MLDAISGMLRSEAETAVFSSYNRPPIMYKVEPLSDRTDTMIALMC